MTKLHGIPVLILDNLFKFLGCVIVWMAFRKCIHCDQTYDDVFNVEDLLYTMLSQPIDKRCSFFQMISPSSFLYWWQVLYCF